MRRDRLIVHSLLLSLSGALACSSPPQRLDYGVLDSPAMRREMQFSVYTPPGWTAEEELPLVVFLHGAGDDPGCFDRSAVGEHLDAAIEAGRAPRMVIVLPQGSLGFWENWVDGSRLYRDWVMRDLLPVVRERYHTRPCPDGCHVVGISMGGHGALRFALLESGAFASVSAISAPVLDSERMADFGSRFWVNVFVPVERIWGDPEDREKIESQDLFLVWTGPEDLNGVHVLLAWGHHDLPGIATSSEAFHAHLEEHGIPHEAVIFDGSHDWRSWKPVLERVLRVQVGGAHSPKRDRR